MGTTDADVTARIARGEKLADASEASAGYRAELMRVLAVFVDSELAGTAGLVPFINSAPGLRERATAARIVAEKFDHAQTVLEIMAPFGINPTLYVRAHCWASRLDRDLDLGSRRVGGDKRLNVFHAPLEGWLDAVTMNMLMGTAVSVQLGELADCSFRPLCAVMGDIAAREAAHAAAGETGIAQAIARGRTTAASQVAVDYWYPRVAHTFGRVDSLHFERYRQFGLRRHTNAELLNRWVAGINPRLTALGLTAPPIPS
ncbi:Phenylacetic acid catabolic protein [Roseospira goensis]|uniref:1,2-phenylacetyl-CoA epoxidase catalytic subunit n=1 Tax=Roseospira goensis TaxID=391922 RepID=A0A7W6RZ77_9PROT|nr:Phenylacetic acid catabolic protein [Roseospira goensis]MBB4285324.1 1,2-phenylacetyl-CoA epoxidase catalytic subunit [Roseospira goensis]